jgi:hypothetical protein
MCAVEDSRVHSEWAQISGQEKIAEFLAKGQKVVDSVKWGGS